MVIGWTWLVWMELVWVCYVAGRYIAPAGSARWAAQVREAQDLALGRRRPRLTVHGAAPDFRMAPLLGPPITPPNRGQGFDPQVPWLSGR